MSKITLKIGAVSMSAFAMAGSVATSAIAAISKSFPDTPISTVQLLGTLPGLGSLIITLIAGQMAMHISKKSLALLGIALVTAGGLIPAFGTTLWLVCSCVPLSWAWGLALFQPSTQWY